MNPKVRSGRAQGLSRSAVALPWPHAPSFPGRALTGPSTAATLVVVGTMIVALARKLLIALWRLVTTGEVPD